MNDTISEIIDGIRRGSQDIQQEVRNMDSIQTQIISGWQGKSSEAYSEKLHRLTSEIESVHKEIDNLLEMIQ